MKKSFLLVCIGFLLLQAKAQQQPLYSQIYFMRMLYNPALTAYNGGTNLYGFYREQWTGMPGHPVTAGAVGEISLWEERIGTGFHVYADNTDLIHRISAQAYYAQKIKLAEDHVLSLGLSLGIINAYVDYRNAVATDAGDPHLLIEGKNGVAFDMSVGLAYQWKKKLTVSFAVPQVANTHATIAEQLNGTTYSNRRQFIGAVSYEISIKDETYNIEPCVMVKAPSSLPLQIDGNIMFNWKRLLYVGVGYRMDNGVDAQVAVRIAKAVTIGYAYEFPIMKKATYNDTKGTHEVLLGLNFDRWLKKGKDKGENKELMRQSQLDSLIAANDSLRKDVDSLRKDMDTAKADIATLKQGSSELQKRNEELQRQSDEQEEKAKELKKNMEHIQNMVKDSFERMAKEYKKHISERPAVNFPSSVDKNTKARKGDVFRLNNVEFDRNSSFLQKQSYTELDKVISFMDVNPNTTIRIMGHTDYLASDEYNQWLSDRRAKRVYDYLEEKGVSKDRMTYIGFGKKVPIADNETEEGRAKNRRVEIEVVK